MKYFDVIRIKTINKAEPMRPEKHLATRTCYHTRETKLSISILRLDCIENVRSRNNGEKNGNYDRVLAPEILRPSDAAKLVNFSV
jgi:hypothetical protein